MFAVLSVSMLVQGSISRPVLLYCCWLRVEQVEPFVDLERRARHPYPLMILSVFPVTLLRWFPRQ